jgi:uncharacterized transporter YbjL
MDIPVAGGAKAILYLLFLVGNGYSIGPQFFRSLKGEGIRYLSLAVFQCSLGLIGAVAMARMLHLDVGMAAGLLSGALTQSPAIGTATETIAALPLPQDQKSLLIAHVAIGDALTYLFGTAASSGFTGHRSRCYVDLVSRQETRRRLNIDKSRRSSFPYLLAARLPFIVRRSR